MLVSDFSVRKIGNAPAAGLTQLSRPNESELCRLTTRIMGRRELTLISKSGGYRRSCGCDGSPHCAGIRFTMP